MGNCIHQRNYQSSSKDWSPSDPYNTNAKPMQKSLLQYKYNWNCHDAILFGCGALRWQVVIIFALHLVLSLQLYSCAVVVKPPHYTCFIDVACTKSRFAFCKRATFRRHASPVHRPERWSIFQGDGMAMVVFLQRWNGDGLWKFSPSPSMVPGRINHWQRWFFNGFFNFGDQWFTMDTKRKPLIIRFFT